MAPRRRLMAPIAVGAAALVLAGAYWASRQRSEHPRSRSTKVRWAVVLTQNPSLSLSFPPDAALAAALDTVDLRGLLTALSAAYDVHVLVDDPRCTAPSLDTARILAYSQPVGRAMLARALQCQYHVELVLVNADGGVALDDPGVSDPLAALAEYLARLEQLARAVDVLHVVMVHSAPRTHVTVNVATLRNALSTHTLAQQSNVKVAEARNWHDLQRHLEQHRSTWTT